MNNYPPGAANDPRAPYNEEPIQEVLLEWEETLTKAVYVPEADETGSEQDHFEAVYRTALQCINDCHKVVRQLIKEGRTFFAGMSMTSLEWDLREWEK